VSSVFLVICMVVLPCRDHASLRRVVE